MLKKFNKRIPRKVYKILGQVHGTGASSDKQLAYHRARFLMGMNAEAMEADVVLYTHYSDPIKINNKIKVLIQELPLKLQTKNS